MLKNAFDYTQKHQNQEDDQYEIQIRNPVGIDSLTEKYIFCINTLTEAVAVAALVLDFCPFKVLSSRPRK